jgi:hypothetical protein
MKFPWLDLGDGLVMPMLRAAVRHNQVTLPFEPLLRVDTGADGTILPRQMAKMLGFGPNDLSSEKCGSAGGPIEVDTPIDLGRVEMHVCGEWIRLPSLKFADSSMALLGRDVIFSHFDLAMTSENFDLNWR